MPESRNLALGALGPETLRNNRFYIGFCEVPGGPRIEESGPGRPEAGLGSDSRVVVVVGVDFEVILDQNICVFLSEMTFVVISLQRDEADHHQVPCLCTKLATKIFCR